MDETTRHTPSADFVSRLICKAVFMIYISGFALISFAVMDRDNTVLSMDAMDDWRDIAGCDCVSREIRTCCNVVFVFRGAETERVFSFPFPFERDFVFRNLSLSSSSSLSDSGGVAAGVCVTDDVREAEP